MRVSQIGGGQSALLDALRYFLAAVVVVGHGLGFFHGYFGGFFPRVFPHPQSIAVVGFFYLSGFLIVGSQLQKKAGAHNTLKIYLFDRAIRVYVTLVASLLFVAGVDLFFFRHTGLRLDLVSLFATGGVFMKNLFLIPSVPFGTLRPIWSLMYEWWIYVLFGGLFFWRRNMVVGTLLVVAGLHYTLRVNGQGESGHIWTIWALGGACSWVQQRADWAKSARGWMLDLLAMCFLAAAGWLYYMAKNAYNLPAGVMLSLSIFVFVNSRGRLCQLAYAWRNVLKKLAGFSFTLFLTHYTVLTYLREYWHLEGWNGVLVGFVTSNLVAFLIASLTEYRLSAVKLFLLDASQRYSQILGWR
jgi:peptidoglycan/LPS O-acetylase OafA/YrhL